MKGKFKWICWIRDQSIKFEECESFAHAFDTQKIVKHLREEALQLNALFENLRIIDLFIPLGPS